MYITNKIKKYPCTGYYPTETDVRFSGIEGVTLPLTGSIMLVSDDDDRILAIQDCADYARQTFENGVLTLTNEPLPMPPTIDEIRTDKLNSLNGMCSGAIYAGLTINGKHYNFSSLAQESIKGLMQEIQQGATVVPYKADGEGYTPHTAEQMTTIAKTMSEWIKVNTHYYDLLKQWVERETDETIINSIHYGSILPNDLMQTLALQLAQYGVDITKYASMLGG